MWPPNPATNLTPPRSCSYVAIPLTRFPQTEKGDERGEKKCNNLLLFLSRDINKAAKSGGKRVESRKNYRLFSASRDKVRRPSFSTILLCMHGAARGKDLHLPIQTGSTDLFFFFLCQRCIFVALFLGQHWQHHKTKKEGRGSIFWLLSYRSRSCPKAAHRPYPMHPYCP